MWKNRHFMRYILLVPESTINSGSKHAEKTTPREILVRQGKTDGNGKIVSQPEHPLLGNTKLVRAHTRTCGEKRGVLNREGGLREGKASGRRGIHPGCTAISPMLPGVEVRTWSQPAWKTKTVKIKNEGEIEKSVTKSRRDESP